MSAAIMPSANTKHLTTVLDATHQHRRYVTLIIGEYESTSDLVLERPENRLCEPSYLLALDAS